MYSTTETFARDKQIGCKFDTMGTLSNLDVEMKNGLEKPEATQSSGLNDN
jgi:hypothetical protein